MSLQVILLYLDSKLIKFRSPGRWPSGVSTDLGIVERSHPSTRHWPQSVHYLSANWFKKNDPLENMAGWNIPISHRKYIFKGSIFHFYVSLPECIPAHEELFMLSTLARNCQASLMIALPSSLVLVTHLPAPGTTT